MEVARRVLKVQSLLFACASLLPLAKAAAETLPIVTSSAAESVALSIYRAPIKYGSPLDQQWPEGYALITETRVLALPAGEFVIRFEGVADGMYPESAIVSGLPEGVREKNRDARLLSPAGLVDAYLKRTVRLTRTTLATGEVREMQARITAAPGGAVMLESDEGFEALHCTGLPERMGFSEVPANLSAKPTLSVLAQSARPAKVTVTLSYIAEGFGWQANYLATIRSRDARGFAKVDLFAWLTLANGGDQSFLDAQTVAIAGQPNREETVNSVDAVGGPLKLQCWPAGRSHQVPFNRGYIPVPPPPPPPAPGAPMLESITVTGSRIRRADAESASPVLAIQVEQEDLGDLKLYRVPEPVTVSANGLKQVALLVKPEAKFEWFYRARFGNEELDDAMTLTLRSENTEKNGLGLPLPKGQMEIFETGDNRSLWIGQANVSDRAIGEKLRIEVASASDVRIKTTKLVLSKRADGQRVRWRITLSNARANPVRAEVEIPMPVAKISAALKRQDDVPVWQTRLPANGERVLEFEIDERFDD